MEKSGFLKLLKKKVLFVLLADFLFFSTLLWFLVYARNRIFSYLVVIQQFAPKITGISSALAMEDASSVGQLDALLKVVEPIVNEANFFIYFVVPVMIFLLWVLLQGFSWGLLKNDSVKKALHFNFYPKFALFSIPLFVVVFFLFRGFLNLAEQVNLTKSVILFIVLFIVFYFTIISYLVIDRAKFLSSLVNLSIKRSKIFFPAFLLFLIIFLLTLILFFNNYIYALSLILPSALSIFLFLFFMLLFSCSKCLLAFLSQ